MRERLLRDATVVATAQQRLEASIREYNFTHGLTPQGNHPSRLDQVRHCGGNLAHEMNGDDEPDPRLNPVNRSTVPPS